MLKYWDLTVFRQKSLSRGFARRGKSLSVSDNPWHTFRQPADTGGQKHGFPSSKFCKKPLHLSYLNEVSNSPYTSKIAGCSAFVLRLARACELQVNISGLSRLKGEDLG